MAQLLEKIGCTLMSVAIVQASPYGCQKMSSTSACRVLETEWSNLFLSVAPIAYGNGTETTASCSIIEYVFQSCL